MLGEGSRVRVHFLVHSQDGLPEVENADLERDVVQLARTWDDALADALTERFGQARGRLLRSIWASHLPEHYKGYTSPPVGALDIALLEQLSEQGPLVVSLQPLASHTRIALYKRGPKVELGEALPMLEDLGLRVIEEISTRLTGDDETWVQEFRVLGPDGERLDLDAVGDRVAELLAAVHRGDAETDNLNRLVLTAGLDRRQVAILRAYRKYRQRVGSRFTESYQNDVLVANSEITAKLVRFFELRFDPELETDEAAEVALRDEILADLDAVASLDHDRILRNQLTVIDATLRTNAYNADREALAFKLKSADVPADAAARAVPRDLRLLTRRRGHPPARWADRARRPALVGPAGLPHRGLRPDARAADQERGDRARRREGRLLHQARRRRRAPLRHVHPLAALRHRQPRRRPGRPAGSGAGARRRGHVPRGGGRQGDGDVLRHRQPRLPRVRLLARRRVRVRWLGGLRPQGARHHGQGRVGVRQAPLQGARRRHAGRRVHRRRHRRHERRRVRQRDAAERQDPARRGLRPPAHLHRSHARRGRRLRGAQAAVRDAALELGRLRPRQALRRRRASTRAPRSRSSSARRLARRWASRTSHSRPTTSSARSCARPSTCCGTVASARS